MTNTLPCPQSEFDAIRAATGPGRSYFASSKLLVLPHWFMRHLGGAAAIWRWVCISKELVRAPDDVRQAVIAHEWGHVYSGHCLATMGSIFMANVYVLTTITQPPSWGLMVFNISLLAMIGAMLLWALQPKRELEADAVAATVVGRKGMAKGLRWIVTHVKAGQMSEAVKYRLSELER